MNRVRSVPARCIPALAGTMIFVLGGCGPTRLTVPTDVPSLLVVPLPMTVGLRMPKSFTEYVQKEKVLESPWEIRLGPAQSEAMRRVMSALFQHVVVLGEDTGAAAGQHLDGIIETTLDSYVYLLPTPGSGFYSATVGFKVNLESPGGTLLGSWVYEGYGSAPERGLSNSAGVKQVTALAIRDACANLAVHLPEQELLRNLLAPPPGQAPATSPAGQAPADTPPAGQAPPVAPSATPPAPERPGGTEAPPGSTGA